MLQYKIFLKLKERKEGQEGSRERRRKEGREGGRASVAGGGAGNGVLCGAGWLAQTAAQRRGRRKNLATVTGPFPSP